jgi:ariadne-1
VKKLLQELDEESLERYEHAVVNSYIEDNANVRWCPSVPCCERAVEVLDDGYCEPRCTCGLAFCFKCGSSPHSPATCKMWQQWEVKMNDDSETVNYLKVSSTPMEQHLW